MLKNNHLSEHRVSRGSRFAVIAVLALSTIFALGLRNGAGKVTAQDDTTAEPGVSEIAQAENAAIPHAKSIPFPLTYAPDDAIAIFAVRPSELLAKPALKSLAELILKNERTAKPMGIPLEQIEQVVFSFGTRDTDRHEPELIAAMIRISGKLDLETLKAEITPNSETGFYGGQLYLREAGRHDPAFWLADEHTLIYSQTETGLKQAIDARNLSVNREKRIPVWGSVANQTAAGYANIGQLRRMFNGEDRFGGEGYGRPMQPGQQFQKSMGLNPMFGPLWNDVETITGGAVFGQDIDAKLTATSKDENGAGKVEETLKAMLVLGRNMINQNQQMIGQLPQQEQKMVGALLTLSQEVFKTLKVEKAQAQVIVEAKLPENTARLITTSLVPAVLAGQQSANQAISKNNLKQIGLAMHNYADVHKKFPTPVVMGPDGKTPHSWRVEILPFIDQIELYNQYHMNEPWDSESNKKLVAKIPPVYRHPLDKPDSTNASYFALVGSHTLMGDNKKGTWFGDITDGTSNTLMIVEAKREIPWTKPDDIPYADDRSKPVPALGGWFNEGFIAALGDGSVRMFSGKLSKATLQKLIERDDGNPISGDELDGKPGGPNSDSPLSPRGDSGGESGGSAEAYDVDGSETGSAPRRGFGTDRRIKSPE